MATLQPKTKIFGLFLLACFAWQVLVYTGLKRMEIPNTYNQSVQRVKKKAPQSKEAALPIQTAGAVSKF